MDDKEIIAERVIYAIDKNGREFDIGLKIGKPYQKVDTPFRDWACPVATIGIYGSNHPDMVGVDAWQALTLAMHLIRDILNHFVEDGGKLFDDKNGNQISVDQLFAQATEIPEKMPPLTDDQQERVGKLTDEELQKIDDALIADASTQFRKVARIVGMAIGANRDSIPNVPDIFYASRVRKLVEEGRLISQGNLDHMRFSEVKLPD